MAWVTIKGRSQGKFSGKLSLIKLQVLLNCTISDVKYTHTLPHIATVFVNIHREAEVFRKVWLTILRRDAIVNGHLATTIVGIRVVFVTIHVPFMLLNK